MIRRMWMPQHQSPTSLERLVLVTGEQDSLVCSLSGEETQICLRDLDCRHDSALLFEFFQIR